MKAVFIADAHLSGASDPNQKKLAKFLDSLSDIDTLFILGDIFDYWSGYDEVAGREYKEVLGSLKRVSAKGIKIIYLEGNHDFSMGPFFTDTVKADVYPDEAEITLDNKRAYLAHGDTVNMSLGYRLWRGLLRSFFFRIIVRLIPPEQGWNIAMRLSGKSRQYSIHKAVVEERLKAFAQKKISEGFDIVVLGHSHSAAVHDENAGARKGVYANPGSFSKGSSHLVFEGGRLRVKR
ncbi:MAG: UDP-2,3-diacylglucosamine diphosphatase [Deltaproteobacteria bacterium]|nr:UDP-2,3-diacylglucosamine diphosphatase [Deltaproteobacteria bacterium]